MQRLIIDSASAQRYAIHAVACCALGIRPPPAPTPTDPGATARPKRFLHTLLAGWACGAIHRNSTERRAA